MVEVFVGTSGWSYSWNLGNSLEWYVQQSGLNAIELNMSFYRFPYPNMVKSWAVKGKDLAWVVKVHRSITHFQKLGPSTVAGFERFKNIFTPLKDCIHYYLFQLPPSFTDLDRLEAFIGQVGTEKLAVEFRHASLFTEELKAWGKTHGVLLVSIDAPRLPTTVMSDTIVYERIHGRTGWYSHDYSDQELAEIKERILAGRPKRVYVFFNNNHAMLENAVRMHRFLSETP